MHPSEITIEERFIVRALREHAPDREERMLKALISAPRGKMRETLIDAKVFTAKEIGDAVAAARQLASQSGVNFELPSDISEAHTMIGGEPGPAIDSGDDIADTPTVISKEKPSSPGGMTEPPSDFDVEAGWEERTHIDQYDSSHDMGPRITSPESSPYAGVAPPMGLGDEGGGDTTRRLSKAEEESFATTGSMAPSRYATRSMSREDMIEVDRLRRGERRDLIGVNLGGYRIHGKLGAGGMGDVYIATQLSLGRDVALKILPPGLAKEEELIDRFHQEAQTLAKFAHSNIVQIFDVDCQVGVHYITMEQVRGQTLKNFIDSQKEVDLGVITNMLKQCVRGLSRAHKEGIIHRDIKPGNILIDELGEIKLVDFGLATPVDRESGSHNSEGVMGTPLYMSPEQASGVNVDFRTDVYSLGVTFYQLVTGDPPFKAMSAWDLIDLHINAEPRHLSLRRQDLPPKFCDLIMRMLEKNPDDRFKSYEELFKAIEKIELDEGIINSQSDMLSDSLMAIGDRGVRALWKKIGLMAGVAVTLFLLAFGISSLMDSAGAFDLKAVVGDIGTIFLGLTYGSIFYVFLARNKYVPIYGKLKNWMDAHIVFALFAFVLVMIHSGNFWPGLWGGDTGWEFRGVESRHQPALLPALNSAVFAIVIFSGLVGRTIWRDIVKQVSTERIKQGGGSMPEDNRLTLTVFSQSVFKMWRILHYPLAVALLVLTIVHVVTVMYYGG